VAQSMREVGFNSAIALLSTYAGQASDLRSWLVDAGINRDGNLRLQYLAGLALNNSMEGAIYRPDADLSPVPGEPVCGLRSGRQSLMMALSQ